MQKLEGDLDGETPIYRRDEVLHRLLSTSPEIAVAMTNIERARWSAERARVEKTPNLTVQGLVNVIDNGIGGRSDGSVTLGVPLPIWNRNQGAIVQAANEAAAAERALERLELNLQSRLAPVFERYSSSLNQVARYRTRILPAAQQTLESTRRLYEAGEFGYINLLTAQRTYAQTNLAYLESLRQLREATVTIDGLLLSDSLSAEQPNR
jgi:cobalt-zinc-cadmium efflux system outer membrane protein